MSSRLFVVGDSFCEPPKVIDKTPTWPAIVAKQLSNKLGKEVLLENYSIVGCSQDYCWEALNNILEYDITQDDYLIIGLTHPNRVWYFDDKPNLSNAHVMDMKEYIGRDKAKAVEYYIRYIQRPRLDTIHVTNRMGYVAYQVLKKTLHTPLLLKCFEQFIDQGSNWSELNFANGALSNIQSQEFSDHIQKCHSDPNNFWKGKDGRYNHMCLSNHKILADKIVNSLLTNDICDLTKGFKERLIKEDALTDNNFIQKELDVNATLNWK